MTLNTVKKFNHFRHFFSAKKSVNFLRLVLMARQRVVARRLRWYGERPGWARVRRGTTGAPARPFVRRLSYAGALRSDRR